MNILRVGTIRPVSLLTPTCPRFCSLQETDCTRSSLYKKDVGPQILQGLPVPPAAASMILLWVNRLNPAGCIDPQQLSCTNFQMHGGKTKTTTCTALQRLNHPSKRTCPGCCNLLERLLISPCTERVSPQTHPIGRADRVEKAQYFVKHLQRQRATGIGHAGPL